MVGDVAIVAKRFRHAAFTQPYTESGLVMIVPVRIRPQTNNRGFLFMKPFTKAMWALVGAIIVYNGFVVWLIERNHNHELKGSASNQIGALLCLAFTSLFSLHGILEFLFLFLLAFFTIDSKTIMLKQKLIHNKFHNH